ncbi:MAG: tetratricopeptide repeat protein [Euryarchaeota archaeon]|nr:tetratricopeptide repeat protein [Euryarchaeota archaeon]
MERSKDSISDRINCNSSTSPKVTLYRYSPENIDYEVLKSIFVGRDGLFENTFKELETAGKNKTPRFYLLVGSRGIGKSHFLIMLYYKIKQELSSLYIPVKFAEEEYSVYRASDFFLRILQETNENISDILSLNNEDEILDASLGKLKEIVKKENKIYLIFVENLHEVFQQLERKEIQKLRSIFQKHDFFSVVASSPIIFAEITSHEEPFYNFFRIQHLRELSSSEIKILLKKIAEIECNKEFLENFEKYETRMEGMTHLTGGTPRLVIFFYELISRDNFEDIEKVFFKILDEHTPYYQEIFQLLTGQKRLIFDTVISSESPMTPKQIAEKSRIDASVVTTQLRRLEKDGYVLSRPAGRETYYEVRERLFRLWRELRQPLGRKRISILVNFLKLWYSSEELKEHFERKLHLLESGNKNILIDLRYRVEALSGKHKTEALLKLTPKIIEFEEWEEADHDIQKLKEIANKSKDIDLKAKYLIFEIPLHYKSDKVALETFKKGLKYDTKDYSYLLDSDYTTVCRELLNVLDKVLKLNPKDEYALLKKGHVLVLLKRYEEALEVFNKILVLNPDNEYALSRKGYALALLKRYEEALEVFNKVLVLNPDEEYALSRKGNILYLLGRYEEALEVFNKILILNPDDEDALSRKGSALVSLGRHEEALEVFNKILILNPDDEYALSRKGDILYLLGRYEEAIEVFNKVLVLNPDNEYALSRKGSALGSLGRYEEALEVSNKALELNPDNEYALSRKGSALALLERYEEALEVSNKALEVSNKALELNPDNEYALSVKGYVLILLERYEEAIEIFVKVKNIASNESFKIEIILSLIGVYLSLNQVAKANTEIELIKSKISNQTPRLIKKFIEAVWKIVFEELKIGNLGNGRKLIRTIFDLELQLKKETFEASMMGFFKTVVDSGEFEVLKITVDEIMKIKGGKFPELLKPLLNAVEIVETKDIQKYYKLQVEEREIVADIVQKVSKSEDLSP